MSTESVSGVDSVDSVKADIAVHRAELAETVEQLAEKLDVKSHAKARAAELKPYVAPAAGVLAAVTLLVALWKRRS